MLKQPFWLRNGFEATSKPDSPARVGPGSKFEVEAAILASKWLRSGFEARMAASTSKPTCQFNLTSTFESATLTSKWLRSHFEARVSCQGWPRLEIRSRSSGFEVASKWLRSQNGCFDFEVASKSE